MKVIRLSTLQVLMTSLYLLATSSAFADLHSQRQPVLAQVAHPHSYYWREMYMPQLSSGPSAASYSPKADELIYSMKGSLWRQKIASDTAYQLTNGAGYDYQPDWSPDGRQVIFTRQNNNALNLVLLNLATGKEQLLTKGSAVNVEPRWSPDGKQIVFVSSKQDGYFGIYLADVKAEGLNHIRPLVVGNKTEQDRYYYSQIDHAINPSWSPDGKRIYYVSNQDVAWGSGDIWSVAVANPLDKKRILVEETTWSARPELAHDGKRLLYSSYQGRQFHQLWLTTTEGLSPLPLTFGDYDIKMARWSKDDRFITYTSNETGGLSLWHHAVVGGERKKISAKQLNYLQPMIKVELSLVDEKGSLLDGRIILKAADGKHYAPDNTRIHADDFFNSTLGDHENHYFHCSKRCVINVPEGDISVLAASGYGHQTADLNFKANKSNSIIAMTLPSISLPDKFGKYISADMHVHMNYGGQYLQTISGLARQAKAEGLDVVYNLLVNKEQRIPDISQFKTKADTIDGVSIYQAQEFHTSYWGHMSFLHLDDHLLTPDFSSYRHTAMASPYPSNAVMSELAHKQGALVGYVHPFDWLPDPEGAANLSNSLPIDVVLGKADFLEVVSFADHEQTAAVWYKFLNLGYHLAAGAGTDAMTNYASLRGPVGLNRVYLKAQANNVDTLKKAIKSGNGFVTNGPLLGLQAILEGTTTVAAPGERLFIDNDKQLVDVHVAMNSFVPISHLELVKNGKLIKTIDLKDNAYKAEAVVSIAAEESGWILLRAYNENANPFVQDIYSYATTNPIWIEVKDQPQQASDDARYFIRWINRLKNHVLEREADFNASWELDKILADIEQALNLLSLKI